MYTLSFITIVWFAIVRFFVNDKQSWFQFSIYRLIWIILITMYSVLIILCINVKAFKLSLKQFIFWFKIYASFKYTITGFTLSEDFDMVRFDLAKDELVVSGQIKYYFILIHCY